MLAQLLPASDEGSFWGPEFWWMNLLTDSAVKAGWISSPGTLFRDASRDEQPICEMRKRQPHLERIQKPDEVCLSNRSPSIQNFKTYRLSFLKLSFITLTIRIHKLSVTMWLITHPVSFITRSIWICHFTLAMRLVINPFTGIKFSIFPCLYALANR